MSTQILAIDDSDRLCRTRLLAGLASLLSVGILGATMVAIDQHVFAGVIAVMRGLALLAVYAAYVTWVVCDLKIERGFRWLGLFVALLPGVGLLLYLVATRGPVGVLMFLATYLAACVSVGLIGLAGFVLLQATKLL